MGNGQFTEAPARRYKSKGWVDIKLLDKLCPKRFTDEGAQRALVQPASRWRARARPTRHYAVGPVVSGQLEAVNKYVRPARNNQELVAPRTSVPNAGFKSKQVSVPTYGIGSLLCRFLIVVHLVFWFLIVVHCALLLYRRIW